MSAHQPVTAAVRNGAAEPSPTMNELLAACAAASAVSTPPEPPSRAEDRTEGDARGDGRDTAAQDAAPCPHGAQARDAA
ncbi:hypothetical protein [Streptomyces sp. NPDC059788]|uniref:hypothetical protein n=1 Tax=Streptomyces sp. NPDC059788 TaxID=3346948 RepID=UPI00364CEB25